MKPEKTSEQLPTLISFSGVSTTGAPQKSGRLEAGVFIVDKSSTVPSAALAFSWVGSSIMEFQVAVSTGSWEATSLEESPSESPGAIDM